MEKKTVHDPSDLKFKILVPFIIDSLQTGLYPFMNSIYPAVSHIAWGQFSLSCIFNTQVLHHMVKVDTIPCKGQNWEEEMDVEL